MCGGGGEQQQMCCNENCPEPVKSLKFVKITESTLAGREDSLHPKLFCPQIPAARSQFQLPDLIELDGLPQLTMSIGLPS
jgi:hypothetical protein